MLFHRGHITNVAAHAGPSFDAATTAWANAVISDGGTVGASQKGFVDTLIRGLKTDGLFTLGDALWLYGSENVHQAKISLLDPTVRSCRWVGWN
jgi:hypothetical protein